MTEIWKNIDGYDGYQVSNLGNVRSLNFRRSGKTRALKPVKMDVYGHLYVGLFKNRRAKYVTVHRLVAMAFLDGFSKDLVVHHIDHNPQNNQYTNLMLMTASEHSKETLEFRRIHRKNGIRRTTAKMLKKAERNARIFKLIDQGVQYREIAARFNLSEISIKKLAQKHKAGKQS